MYEILKFKKTKSVRSVNRKNWDLNILTKKLEKSSSINSKIYSSLIKLIVLRKKQPAFHPNATQFTLQLDDFFFGIWRQSIDRSQSIFCVSNLEKSRKKLFLHDINLISTNNWFDLLKNKKIKLHKLRWKFKIIDPKLSANLLEEYTKVVIKIRLIIHITIPFKLPAKISS